MGEIENILRLCGLKKFVARASLKFAAEEEAEALKFVQINIQQQPGY
jgi:hypothetical protein